MTTVVRGLAVAALLTILAACSGAASSDDPTDPTEPGPPSSTTAPSGVGTTEPVPTSTTAPTPTDSPGGELSLYTSVTEDTVTAVVEAFEQVVPDVEIEVFRAPTGELNARVAAERREGGIGADVLWLTDPLSMTEFAEQDELASIDVASEDVIPAEYRTDLYYGTRLLNMVIVADDELADPPTGWAELLTLDDDRPVALPDPAFAGSAFGALGYLATSPEFGPQWYEQLFARGAEQVQTPGEVVTGVAEDRFVAGMTLDFAARAAIDDGAPLQMVWPEPGAIAIYSPIAVVSGSEQQAAAVAFVDHVLSVEGQTAIAGSGWQPIRDDVPWEVGGPAVSPDWDEIASQREQLLEDYQSVAQP